MRAKHSFGIRRCINSINLVPFLWFIRLDTVCFALSVPCIIQSSKPVLQTTKEKGRPSSRGRDKPRQGTPSPHPIAQMLVRSSNLVTQRDSSRQCTRPANNYDIILNLEIQTTWQTLYCSYIVECILTQYLLIDIKKKHNTFFLLCYLLVCIMVHWMFD